MSLLSVFLDLWFLGLRFRLGCFGEFLAGIHGAGIHRQTWNGSFYGGGGEGLGYSLLASAAAAPSTTPTASATAGLAKAS
ncbi:MAG TPA: hypothetical protein VN911_06485 [Candidatus Acidoferrum sp.]|nr:hypothetical protein [Candidatus Acidoferrum sp.]